MTREQYDELSAPLVRTLLDMEDDILREIAAQLAKDGKVSDTSKWRIRQLARSGRFDKRAAAIIDGYSGVQNGQALDMVLAAAQTEIGYLDNAVQAANAAGLAEYFSDIPAEASALNAAKAFQRQAASDLNLVNTVMKYKAGSAFVSAVNSVYRESQKSRQDVLDVMGKSSAKVVMGNMSLQEATRKTIRELARKGIPAFTDKLGREWSPEAYIMMDMRSTLANTARAAQDMRCDQYGIQLIEVSSHMGARPLCAPYQGRIFSRDGSKGITTDGAGGKIYYTPLSETSYGQPAGLFGINCGHVQYPFVPGVNFQRYFPYPEEENAERYKQFQRQRAMERDIRATKRECMMLQETGDTEGLQKASQRLRAQKQKYSQYSKDCGLGTHYDRTQVYGYDRSKSSKTVWAERKAQSAKKGGGSSGGAASTGSGGRAVTVSVPGGSNGGTGKVYSSTTIPQPGTVMYNINPTIISQNLSNALTNNAGNGNIPLGNLNTKVRYPKQNEHTEEHDDWKKACEEEKQNGRNPKSYLYKEIDPQAIVDEAVFNPNTETEYTKRSIYPRQYYTCNSEIGKVYDAKVGDFIPSKRVAIIHSSKGPHVFPVIEK